jgi:hypothetical protein
MPGAPAAGTAALPGVPFILGAPQVGLMLIGRRSLLRPFGACLNDPHHPGLQSLATLGSFTLGYFPPRFQRLHFPTRGSLYSELLCPCTFSADKGF